jgi:Coenzyme PQQ synthesis protein D (PqqD)
VAGTIYRRSLDLMEAELGDELVALDPNAGECFGFNSVATSVWRELEQPKTFEQLHNALLGQYEVEPEQCARELQELLDDLSAKGLVTAAN